MKAIRHQITRAKREMLVLLLMLVVSAAALAAGVATAQSPTGAESSPAHPCESLSAITMIVSAPTLAAGNDLTKQAAAPSGNCALTVTLYASAHTSADPQLGSDETCTVTVTPSVRGDGTAAEVQRHGICRALPVETRIDVSPESTTPSGASGVTGASNHPSIARSRVSVRGIRPTGVWVQSDVRGVWDHTSFSVRLRGDVTYPTITSTSRLSIASQARRVVRHYAPNEISITASNRIRWLYLVDDEFTTYAALTMRPNGAFSCGHWFSGLSTRSGEVEVAFFAECLP